MSLLEQVISQSLMRSTQGAQAGYDRYNKQQDDYAARQDAQAMRGLRDQMQQGIESGESLLSQSPLVAQMALQDPEKAAQLTNLFSGMSKIQTQDAFLSVPIAASMQYDKATQFWQNKRKDFANNPNMTSQIDQVIAAPPEKRSEMYHGMMELGSSMGLYGSRKQQAKPADVVETEWLMKQPKEVQETHLKLKRGEKPTTQQKLEYERAKSDLAIETASKTEEAKLGIKELNTIAGASRNASKALGTISKLEQLNKKAFEGTLAEPRLAVAKAFKGIIDIEGLSESEQFRAISNELILNKAQNMAGSLSNSDMTFLENTAPTLSNTEQGRGSIIDYSRKIAEREKEYSKQAQQFKKNKGYFNLSEFQQEFDKYAERNPLFPSLPVTTGIAPTEEKKLSEADIMAKYGL